MFREIKPEQKSLMLDNLLVQGCIGPITLHKICFGQFWKTFRFDRNITNAGRHFRSKYG
jgi:hypothetical protein